MQSAAFPCAVQPTTATGATAYIKLTREIGLQFTLQVSKHRQFGDYPYTDYYNRSFTVITLTFIMTFNTTVCTEM